MTRYHHVFTHKSRANDDCPSYERLEFIGDSVIGLVVARWLFDAWPDQQEGFLTRMRTKLVSGACLANLAQHLQLHQFIKMNDRAMASGWNANPRILEDVFESLIGAIYLTEGLVVARQFLISLYTRHINFDDLHKEDNHKDQLMRWCQKQGLELPHYETIKIHRAPHGSDAKHIFEMMTQVYGVTGFGRGHTKKIAQQEAAKHTLRALNIPENF